MYLKTERQLYGRRRPPVLRWLLLLLVLTGAGYLGYHFWQRSGSTLPIGATPTPMPTPTPAAGFYVAEAEDAYLAGRLADAIAAYRRSLELEPHQTEVYLELARLLILTGSPERGVEMARAALKRQPGSARAWALLGLAYDWLDMPAEAVSFCEEAVSLDPTLPEAYAYLAEAYIDNGQWFAANETIATAVKLAPQNVDVLRNQGYVLENQGNYYGAIQTYREALEIHDGLAHLYLAIGRNAVALNNWATARETYDTAVEADPTSAQAFDDRGWTYLLLGEYGIAEQDLLQAIELDPFLGEAYGHLGTLYFQQRNYEDAIESFGPGISYEEARSRRRTVRVVITAEEINAVGTEPEGTEIARAELLHPLAFDAPLRGTFLPAGVDFYDDGADAASAAANGSGTPPVSGHVRLDVIGGRYELALADVPPVPAGKVYVAWFLPLYTPERTLVHSEPLFPTPDGRLVANGTTGAVLGPAIENYYIFALSYYYLDQCDKAMPYIETALRGAPEDEQVLRTLELCQ